VTVAFVENYDMELGRLLCAGADVWLNNPVIPWKRRAPAG